MFVFLQKYGYNEHTGYFYAAYESSVWSQLFAVVHVY